VELPCTSGAQHWDAGDAPPTSSPSTYHFKVQEVESEWHDERDNLTNCVRSSYSPISNCQVCSMASPTFRCTGCYLHSVCWTCLEQCHIHKPPHVVEKWTVS
jgi:hypothetical protein